ncbi:hypothetical protein ACNFBT_01985 [Pseudomonas sp. NY15181]|uniref:hypothetical protein n=1 Tax=Pseudomonas sp. NY15181 TaxID=3400349 RepID=UPI003A8B2A22
MHPHAHTESLQLLRKLANGIDPRHDVPLAANDPCQSPDVIRALFHAIQALESAPDKERASPVKAGKPWTQEEEATLIGRHEAGEPLTAIARAHGRTTGGIRSRLKHLGLIQ